MKTLTTIGLFFAAIGAIFAAVGGWMLWSEHSFSQTAVTAQGTVIGLSEHRDSDGDMTYSPVAEFYASGGKRYQFSSNTGSSSPGFAIGDTVEILYDPGDPNEARIDTFSQRYLLPVIFAALGSIFVAIGGGLATYPIIRGRTISRLKETGLHTVGTVLSISRDRRIRVNEQNPWRVFAEAKHPRTGVMQEFRSDALWHEPYGVTKGCTVPIYLSAQGKKTHFVDVDNAAPSASPEEGGHWKFGQ